MRLGVDASALVAEALRLRGRQLLAHTQLDLVIPEEAWSETMHELERGSRLFIVRQELQESAVVELLDAISSVLRAHITVVPSQVYADRLDEARLRIPPDKREAPLIALGLALDCGIWTADRDFFGCGLAVWTTETLLAHLGIEVL